MKKWFAVLAVIAMCMCMVSCSNSDSGKEGSTENKTAEETGAKVEIVSEKVDVWVNEVVGETDVTYLAEIKNTGDKTVKIDDISIDLEDSEGNIIDSESMPYAVHVVINPGESAFVCEGMANDMDITESDIGRGVLHYTVKERKEIVHPQAEISDFKEVKDDYSTAFVGRVKNTSNEDFVNENEISIMAAVRDSNGKLVAVLHESGFGVETLAAGEEKGFKLVISDGNYKADFSQCTVEPIVYWFGY